MNVNESVLNVVDLIVDKAISKAGYDKTIQATIITCEDATLGKYKCKFQQSTFYAFANNKDDAYSQDDAVYVTIPNNDMKKQKIIIGSVQELGVNYLSELLEQDLYEIVGNNIITFNTEQKNFYLDTFNKDYSYKLYDYNKEDQDNILLVNQQGFKLNILEANSIRFGANIRTSINIKYQYQGSYGIRFNLVFVNNITGNPEIISYIVSENDIEGNPYILAKSYPLFKNVPIENATNFVRVDSIEIYSDGFPNSTNELPVSTTWKLLREGDIQISNLELNAANVYDLDEQKGLNIYIATPYGNFFSNQSIVGEKKSIVATVRYNGKPVPDEQNVEYYWGIEDFKVNSVKHDAYNGYLSKGWRCLNEFEKEIIDDEDEDNYVINWKPATNTHWVEYQTPMPYQTRYKLAIVYNNIVQTKTITIKNIDGVDQIKIQIDNGITEYHYGVGHPTLTCNIIGHNSNNRNFNYYWTFENNTGDIINLAQGTTHPEDEFPETVDGNKIINVRISRITFFGYFRCGVYEVLGNNEEVLIGSGEIKLTNVQSGQDLFSLAINNGSAVYQYNAKGMAPNNETEQTPLQIRPLSFSIYDPSGQVFSENKLRTDCEYTWYFPLKDTMLELPDILKDRAVNNNDNYLKITDMFVLDYKINSNYSADKGNNQIKLQVKYKNGSGDNFILKTETQFLFLQSGDPGTNGTDFVIKLVPNTIMNNPPSIPMVTRINNTYKLNYEINGHHNEQTLQDSNRLLKAQIWYKGQLIWSGFSTSSYDENNGLEDNQITLKSIRWEVLRNTYSSQLQDVSSFVLNSSESGFITCNGFQSDSTFVEDTRADIVKCSIELKFNEINETKVYFGTIPIITAWINDENYRVELQKNSGFNYVLYTTDGVNPAYNDNPFNFILKHYEDNTWKDISLGASVSYEIDTNGDIYTLNDDLEYVSLNSNQLIPVENTYQSLSKNQQRIKPAGRYDGWCVNNAITCIYKINNSSIGAIHIPIHLLLNKFGLDHLNQWDGNSIQIDNQGGHILAPQMGAGFKDTNNRFTGVLMGTVREAGKRKDDVGLLGYSRGQRTFFLNSENGSAIFGKASNNGGQIIIDPSQNKALLYSNNYWKNYDQNGLPTSYLSANENNQGLLIDLSTPKIKFGNGNFMVTENGNLVANDAYLSNAYVNGTIYSNEGRIGNWTIKNTFLYNFNKKIGEPEPDNIGLNHQRTVYIGINGISLYGDSGDFSEQDGDAESEATLSARRGFTVTRDGRMTATHGEIGGFTIFNNALVHQWQGPNKHSDQNRNFKVWIKGIDGQEGKKANPIGINSDKDGTLFRVDNEGEIYAKGGMDISPAEGIRMAKSVGSYSTVNLIGTQTDENDMPMGENYLRIAHGNAEVKINGTVYFSKTDGAVYTKSSSGTYYKVANMKDLDDLKDWARNTFAAK